MGGRYAAYAESMEDIDDFLYREKMPMDLSVKIRRHKKYARSPPPRSLPARVSCPNASDLLTVCLPFVQASLLQPLPLDPGARPEEHERIASKGLHDARLPPHAQQASSPLRAA